MTLQNVKRFLSQFENLKPPMNRYSEETNYLHFLHKRHLMPISDSQVFIALFIALFTGILAVRLGLELYT